MPFATTWMGIEGIMLGEISQRRTNTIWFYSQMNQQNRNSHGYREQWGGARKEGVKRREVGEGD